MEAIYLQDLFSTGGVLVCSNYFLCFFVSLSFQLRSMFYLNSAAAEQENVQRLGIVRVGYFHQSYPTGGPDNDLIRMSIKIIEAVPIRCVAFYLVSGSSLWSKTLELFSLFASPFIRVRTRTINGTFKSVGPNKFTNFCESEDHTLSFDRSKQTPTNMYSLQHRQVRISRIYIISCV
jgi:hypothetical protein